MKWILFTILFFAGCAGSIRYKDKDREVVVWQPSDPKSPAIVSLSPEGAITISTPETHTPASYTEKATVNWLMVFGGLFAVGAVLAFALKAKFPLMPSNLPMGLSIASAVCFALPTVIQEYLLYVLAAGALWAAWTWYSYKHNVRLKNEI